MKSVRHLIGAAVAAAALAAVSGSAQAEWTPYFQCVRAIEQSCGFPFPEDIDVYQQCVSDGVASTCAGLPGDPGLGL